MASAVSCVLPFLVLLLAVIAGTEPAEKREVNHGDPRAGHHGRVLVGDKQPRKAATFRCADHRRGTAWGPDQAWRHWRPHSPPALSLPSRRRQREPKPTPTTPRRWRISTPPGTARRSWLGGRPAAAIPAARRGRASPALAPASPKSNFQGQGSMVLWDTSSPTCSL